MIRLKTQFRNDCSLPKSAAIFRGGDLQAEYGFIEEFAKVLPTEAKRFIRARYLNPTSFEEMIGKINSIDEMGMKGGQGFSSMGILSTSVDVRFTRKLPFSFRTEQTEFTQL